MIYHSLTLLPLPTFSIPPLYSACLVLTKTAFLWISGSLRVQLIIGDESVVLHHLLKILEIMFLEEIGGVEIFRTGSIRLDEQVANRLHH